MDEYRGPCPLYKDSKKDEEYDEEVNFVSKDDKEVDVDIGKDSCDESSNPESCFADSEVDPKYKTNAWVTRYGEHAFVSNRSFCCRLPNPPGIPSIP